jgi:plastocyanin
MKIVKVGVVLVAFAAALVGANALPALAGGCAPESTVHTRGEGAAVTVKDCGFTPTLLFVAPGTAVTWTQADDLPHNVVGLGWGSSEPISRGGNASRTFTEPGIYPYQCSLHAGMSGAVIVGDAAAAGEAATRVGTGEDARVAGVSGDRSVPAAGENNASLALAVLAGAAAVAGGVGIGRRLKR